MKSIQIFAVLVGVLLAQAGHVALADDQALTNEKKEPLDTSLIKREDMNQVKASESQNKKAKKHHKPKVKKHEASVGGPSSEGTGE
ncbi:MAG: hypothetical protein ACJ763_16715 [Bdellovibrionia bacterium]